MHFVPQDCKVLTQSKNTGLTCWLNYPYLCFPCRFFFPPLVPSPDEEHIHKDLHVLLHVCVLVSSVSQPEPRPAGVLLHQVW